MEESQGLLEIMAIFLLVYERKSQILEKKGGERNKILKGVGDQKMHQEQP